MRFVFSLNLVLMFLLAAKERLTDPSGFAGAGTGYFTVGVMALSTLVLLGLIWSKRNFLRGE